MNLSPLVEALNEFDEFSFLDTPLATDLESGHFVALSHAVQRSLRHLQQLSGFLESQKTQRLKIIFHRRYKPIEQCQCHHPFKCGRPFIGKSSSLRSQRDGTEVVLLSLVASTHEKTYSPITFIDKLVKKNELGQPFRLSDHQREVLRLAFAFDQDGRLPWDTILYSCIKKSGKTTLNGALTLAWGFTQEAPNEMLVLANDLEQTLARVFKTMEGIIQHNPELQREAEVQSRTIYLANGTTVTAISGDYAGAAGSNHGFVSCDELWGYTSESSTRLWEELTPVPTRKNSIRFISTYAGFEGESGLLWDLYKQVVSKDEHPEGQGERLHPDLPIYANREARIFAYWDHEPRMPWQTQAYYDSQRKNASARDIFAAS